MDAGRLDRGTVFAGAAIMARLPGHRVLRPALRRPWLAASLRFLLAAGVLGATCLLSCSVERHYKTLSLFFDGVPDPSAPQDPALTGTTRAPGTLPQSAPPPKPRGSSHDPYVSRQCEGCHEFEQNPGNRPAWMLGAPKLIAPVEELCALCHEPPQARYVHGPVAMVRCDLCHAAHDSRFPHLLKNASIDATCLSCHSGETFVTQVAHAEYEPAGCSVCHDPHSSSDPFLLRPELGRTEESGDATGADPEPGS